VIVNITVAQLAATLGSAVVINVPVQVGNDLNHLSNPLTFVLSDGTVDPGQVADATAVSGTTSVQVTTPGSDPQAVSAVLNVGGASHTVSVTVANYASVPVANFPQSLLNSGSGDGFFDVQVIGAGVSDSLTVTFTYPSSVTVAPTLQYYDTTAGAWLTVSSSGGGTPTWNPGFQTITVTFDNTSTPKITGLTGTIFFTGQQPEDASLLSVQSQLMTLRGTVTSPKVGKKLDVALKALAASAYPPLWIDPLHLQPKTGEKVFREEKDAVEILSDLIEDQASGLDYATLANWISLLVAADRGIAQTALTESQAAGGDPKKLTQAANQIAEGDTDVPKHSAEAIADYGNAWKKATSN
jgi:hypothetical protein